MSKRNTISRNPAWVSCISMLTLVAVLLLWTPAAQATEHTVNINGLAFEPADLQIEVGDTVTWVNDGGFHNVRSGDGSFGSGPPSADLWTYSHTFRQGGTFPYDCEVHVGQGMTGTVTVVGVYGDGFDDGTTNNWAQGQPTLQSCDCYFSSDCASGSFCDYGPGGFSTEDICDWMDIKPQGTPGAGCTVVHVGAWGGDICDGICAPSRSGSNLGNEDPAKVAQGIRLWAEAMITPSTAGGGSLSQSLVEQVFAIDWVSPSAAVSLGRHVTDLLILSADKGFYGYFCHWEQHQNEPDPSTWVDLSGDPCRAQIARQITEALAREVEAAGSGLGSLVALPAACPQWRSFFAEQCNEGDGTLGCVENRVRDLAVFLTTPRGHMEYLREILSAPGVQLDF